ncbi:MAG: hypothetical protein ACR2N3_09770 [Pyrinomonadaceae bacterium]
MKKFLIVLSLATLLAFAGCRNSSNTNANMMNANMNINMATPTPVMKTNESATTDPALKTKIEDALKKKGFTDVTVDTSTTPATLRGTYPKAKIADVMATAMEANGGKPVKNEATGN